MRFTLLALVLSACGPQSLRVVMNAENNSGQDGFATLTATGKGESRIELDISAGLETRPQAAHVHEGRCGEIGVVKVGLTSLVPDTARPDRIISTTEASIDLETLQKGTFAINVHHPRDHSLYISCGEVR